MKNCVVVIPVYKAKLPVNEEASFLQCLNVLKHHDIVLITHSGLDLSYYRNIAEQTSKSLGVEFFDKKYFDSVSGYNALCLDKQFYMRFTSYKYMLIYQTDAWVFSDNLEVWCGKGYDYVGAPHFYYKNKQFTREFFGVGNGGFSLRRIQYCIDVLSRPKLLPLFSPKAFALSYRNSGNKVVSFIKSVCKTVGFRNTLSYYMRGDRLNEDLIFGTYAKHIWGISANIPSSEEAANFSFEVHPEFLFHLIGNHLPFGCHAYEKWDYESFWKKYLKR